ncbi:class I SAM-dependent methyltransferase [Actinoplanes sp. L3-i22]|uniref:class I SAM-dependent methyltransferase n=1 Tax=Actinoplanes sp. L3-i22 TaxID=2836373 RepID=UPI001C85B8E5|nr:class I SAM-dependent methyltransferase [Actinoplanes sp. L3-i22]
MTDAGRRLAALPADRRRLLRRLLAAASVKAGYRRYYDEVNERLNANGFGAVSYFLNYGYTPGDDPGQARVELPRHCLNKNSIRLVLELVADCPVEGRAVLDVGCGRGGTAHTLHTYLPPARIVGVDLSAGAVAFCRRAHGFAGFLEADAEALPFRPACFDVVTNVESSHSYPDRTAFFREVFRVLRPGGWFLWTDVLPAAETRRALAALVATGFVVRAERDVTPNVLLSCRETAAQHAMAFGPPDDPGELGEFLALPGSDVYRGMRDGGYRYLMLRLTRPEGEVAWQPR